MRGPEAGDAIDYEQRVRDDLLNQLRDRFDIVANAGRGFRRLQVDCTVFRLERGANLLELESLAVRSLHHVNGTAEGLGEIDPPLTEFAGGQHKDLIARRSQVRDRGLHRPSAGGGEQKHIVLGADEDLQLGQNLLIEGAELRRAMVHVGRGHGELGCRQQRRRSGRIQTGLSEHALPPL